MHQCLLLFFYCAPRGASVQLKGREKAIISSFEQDENYVKGSLSFSTWMADKVGQRPKNLEENNPHLGRSQKMSWCLLCKGTMIVLTLQCLKPSGRFPPYTCCINWCNAATKIVREKEEVATWRIRGSGSVGDCHNSCSPAVFADAKDASKWPHAGCLQNLAWLTRLFTGVRDRAPPARIVISTGS